MPSPRQHENGDILIRVDSRGKQEYVMYRDRQWLPCDGECGTPDLRPKPAPAAIKQYAFDKLVTAGYHAELFPTLKKPEAKE